MLGQSEGPWPLASADSTNVAVNHSGYLQCAGCMAKRIDATNPATLQWKVKPEQDILF
jgi:hypothetical protein